LIRRGEEILVGKGYDPAQERAFYRPPGGGIHFGETSRDAVVREMREELGVALENLRYLGIVENIYTFLGRDGHEIALVYEAAFADPTLYEQVELSAQEEGIGPYRAVWRSPAQMAQEGTPLDPEGLASLLRM
jgi:ADP-ribose pyrophosphatase YjhB (NUDIX family)